MSKSEIRARHFERFTGEIGATRRARQNKSVAPFSRDHHAGQHFQAEPIDFLDWMLFEALRGLGLSVRVAALEVKANCAAAHFLDRCHRGADGSGLVLAAWREAEKTHRGVEFIWRAMATEAADIAGILAGKSDAPRVWHGEDGVDREAVYMGVSGIFVIPVALQWHLAIDRARSVGIDLKPGSATLLEGNA